MQAFSPRVIHRSDPGRIRIEWSDGGETSFTAAELRGLCPCAMCVSETTGVRTHDPSSVPAGLTHENVRLVGNYAIALAFSDGHSTGIYSFRFLRESDPRR